MGLHLLPARSARRLLYSVSSTDVEESEQQSNKRARTSSIVMEYDKYGPGRLERVSDADDEEEKGSFTAVEEVQEDAKEEKWRTCWLECILSMGDAARCYIVELTFQSFSH
jgi:hypothetical protein